MVLPRRGCGGRLDVGLFVGLLIWIPVCHVRAGIDTATATDPMHGFPHQRDSGHGPTWPVKPSWLRDKGIYDDLNGIYDGLNGTYANATTNAVSRIGSNGSAIDKKEKGARARRSSSSREQMLEGFLRSCATDAGRRLRRCRTPLLRDGVSPNQFRGRPEVRE